MVERFKRQIETEITKFCFPCSLGGSVDLDMRRTAARLQAAIVTHTPDASREYDVDGATESTVCAVVCRI